LKGRKTLRDFSLSPRCKRDFGTLRSVECLFPTDVSGQHFGPFFKVMQSKIGTVVCSETSVCKIPKDCRSQKFSFLLLQFCTMGTESFPGVKRPGRGADHPPLLVPRSRKGRVIPLPPLGLRVCYGVPLPYLVTV
jgi:hypothetical protein